GVDHLIYGWLFFGFVVMLLFWAGSFWREDTEEPHLSKDINTISPKKLPLLKLCFVTLVGAATVALWPAYAAYVQPLRNGSVLRLTVPELTNWQRIDRPISAWRPRYISARARIDAVFEKNGHKVGLFV